MVGHQGLGGKLRGESQGVDKDPKGGEEDVGGVEGVVRRESLILGRLEHEGKGRGGYGVRWNRWWGGVRLESGL